MGIVNITGDSFYSQSRCTSLAQTLSLADRMVAEGADIIDFGACSTRPGACHVGPEEEWTRLAPAIAAFRKEYPDVRISIDTYWADVVERAYDTIGDFIINDISAGEDDPRMLPVAGRLGLTYIAMHKRGNSCTMQEMTQYDDVTEDVLEYFKAFAVKAGTFGIKDWILDPGFGFAKTIAQNHTLLRNLDRFKELGQDRKLLVGLSRKSMAYKFLGISPEEALPATQVLQFKALEGGADILRVHDVAAAAGTLALYRQLA